MAVFSCKGFGTTRRVADAAQGYSFNYMVNEEGLCFMAVAKAEFQTRICFAFLARISQEYNVGSRYKATMAQHMGA